LHFSHDDDPDGVEEDDKEQEEEVTVKRRKKGAERSSNRFNGASFNKPKRAFFKYSQAFCLEGQGGESQRVMVRRNK
jgi:hypothetical protein